MTVKSVLHAAALATTIVGASPASAGLVTISSYDMINGNGVPDSVFRNYWDGTYSPAGSNNFVTNAVLSGGKGALADGIIPTLRWDNPSVTNLAGTGQYVGWYQINPVITFHFDGTQTINSVSMYVDASYNGLVGAPVSLLINGSPYAPTVTGFGGGVDPGCAAPFQNTLLCAAKLTVFGSWTGSTINVQPIAGNAVGEALQAGFVKEPWMMVSEVQFTQAVPELSTWAMMLIGFAGLGFVAYRRKAKRNPVPA